MSASTLAVLGPPSGALEAGLAAVVVAALLAWFGYALTGLVPAWRDEPVTRWALAFPALVAYSLALMLAHMATGGLLFQNDLAVRLVVGLTAAGLAAFSIVRWRRLAHSPRDQAVFALGIGTSALAVLVWFSPLVRIFPIGTKGDIAIHSGWTEQLLNGEALPSSPITGDVPNYYPWLFHALLATVTRVTPGGHPFEALGPLQVLQVLGVSAALFAVGYQIAGHSAGCATALLGACAGGWGFLVARGPSLVEDPRADASAAATQYAGDLLRIRSYNAGFGNLVPPYPRDIALALLVASLFLVIRAATSNRPRDYAVAGAVLGMVGLAQTDAFLVGLLTAGVFALVSPRGRRLRIGVALIVPALSIFLLWAGPLLVSYVRLGGFVDTTEHSPVVLPLWAILGGWGIITPLAAFGAYWAFRSRGDPGVRAVAALLAAAGLVVAGSALVPTLLGEGFETIGRQHRYWPLLGLALAILGGLGAAALGTLLWERSPASAVAAAVVVVGFALPSPVLASWAVPKEVPTSAPIRSALLGDRRNVLLQLRDYGDGTCAIASTLGWRVFAYTGFHLLVFGHPEEEENAARVRWADIYDRVAPEEQRLRDQELIMGGTATPTQLQDIIERYGLDAIVVPAEIADAGTFLGLPATPVRSGGKDAVMYAVSGC
jgi:hypothetical protein